MTALVASVPTLACSAWWPSIKDQLHAKVTLGNIEVEVKLAARPTRTGRFYLFVCPRCSANCRDLFVKDEHLGCRTCLKIRHPDQLVPRSRWGRDVVLPARQISRIDDRLARCGPDRNTRRRLRRRRRRLLQRVEQELTRRQMSLAAAAIQMDAIRSFCDDRLQPDLVCEIP